MILGALMRVLPPSLVKIALAAAGEPLVPNWLDAKWLGATLDGSTALVYRGHPDMRDELIAFVEERTLPALLRYEDRNSMRWSVESRVPFCTPRLAELAMSLPSRAFVDGSGRTKAVVRDAFREMLPEAIVNRPKIGFLAPDRRWMGELDQWISGAIADGEQRLSEIISWQKIARRRLRQPALSHQSNSTTWRLASYCAWAREWNIQNARTATQAP